jgi:ubiquinol oxidase
VRTPTAGRIVTDADRLAAAAAGPAHGPGPDRIGPDRIGPDHVDSAGAGRAHIERAVVGRAPVGPAPVGPAPVGPAPVGPAPVGPAPVGPAPVGPAPVGPAPVGPARAGGSRRAPVVPLPMHGAPMPALPRQRYGPRPGASSFPGPHPGPPRRLTAAQTPKLGRRALRREQLATLEASRRRYSLFARLLFVTMDLLYGRARTLEKFQVLEIVARIPYQIWENAAYRTLTRRHRAAVDTGLAHRIHRRIVETREQQDNEQWHLLIVGELLAAQGRRLSRFRFGFLPRMLAAGYYHFAWLLFVLNPRWSYRLNADFEDHAEHSYAWFVVEHPEFETMRHSSAFAEQYGAYETVADLLRQIGHDERMHKLESEAFLAAGPLA